MNQQMFAAFFTTAIVQAGPPSTAISGKRDRSSLIKGQWDARYLVCKRCGERICPANNFTQEEMMEWPGVEQHIIEKHDEREITLMLLGWMGDWEDME